MKKITTILLALTLSVAVASAQKTYVLLAGISNYSELGEKDLPNFTKSLKTLKKIYGKQGYTVTIVTGKNATRENIVSRLKAMTKLAKSDDRIFFHFGGHGSTGGVWGYGQDSSDFLSYDEITSILRNARTKHTACFFESCHSGSAVESLGGEYNISKDSRPIFLMACRPEESSWDYFALSYGHYSLALLQGLRGKADTNGDRQVTLLELFKYVHGSVVKRTKNYENPSHPQLIGSSELYNMVLTRW